MIRLFNTLLVAAGLISTCPQSALGRQKPSDPSASNRIRACSLLPKEEVKKHIPWLAMLDQMKIEEEPMGVSGSACDYPSVRIQVLSFSQGTLDALKKKGGLESVSGVGDEAYLHNNRNRYAELYVKVGKHALTLQANIPNRKIESVKPGVLSLAKALVTKLR